MRWGLDQGGEGERDAVSKAFERSFVEIERAPLLESPLEGALEAHARLSERTRREIRRAAVERILRPSARELLAGG